MFVAALVILLVLDAVWIAYEMCNAPVIDDEDSYIMMDEPDVPPL